MEIENSYGRHGLWLCVARHVSQTVNLTALELRFRRISRGVFPAHLTHHGSKVSNVEIANHRGNSAWLGPILSTGRHWIGGIGAPTTIAIAMIAEPLFVSLPVIRNPLRSLARDKHTIQRAPDRVEQNFGGVRFFHQATPADSIRLRDCFLRVARQEHDCDLRALLYNLFDQLWPTHSRHHDVGQHQVNLAS